MIKLVWGIFKISTHPAGRGTPHSKQASGFFQPCKKYKQMREQMTVVKNGEENVLKLKNLIFFLFN